MRHGPRHPRRHRHPHRHDRPGGPQSEYQGPRGPRDPRQAPIPTTGPTIPVAGVVEAERRRRGVSEAGRPDLPTDSRRRRTPASVARDFGVRDGTVIEGVARDGGGGRRTLVEVQQAGGRSPEEYRTLPHFQDLGSRSPPRALQARGGADRDEPAGHRPDRSDRTGPARADRLPAESGQNDAVGAPGAGDRQAPSRSPPHHAPHRRAPRGGHPLPARGAGRGAGLFVRFRFGRPHPPRAPRDGARQAPGRVGAARRHPARQPHAPRPRQQPRDGAGRPHDERGRRQPRLAVPAAVFRRGPQLRGERKPDDSGHRPEWTRAAGWTRSSSRSSRARAIWSSSWTGASRTGGSSRPWTS